MVASTAVHRPMRLIVRLLDLLKKSIKTLKRASRTSNIRLSHQPIVRSRKHISAHEKAKSYAGLSSKPKAKKSVPVTTPFIEWFLFRRH